MKRRNSLSAATSISKDASVLTGVFAMVDVRVGQDAQIDCSDVVAGKMAELGAVIVKRYTPRVTHIVLSQLTPVWKDKIAKWSSNVTMSLTRQRDGKGEVQIVSQLWVNACYVSKTRMDEKPFFPVSKSTLGAGIEGHYHLNGAMRQFAAMHSASLATTPTTTATVAAAATPRPLPSTDSSISVSNSVSSSANSSANSMRTMPGSTSNRRKTLDGKGASAITNEKKSVHSAGVPSLPTRKSAIQFQFGAAAALAAATLSTHAVARKRKALSMEPMASDSIQKLLAAETRGSPVTPAKEVCELCLGDCMLMRDFVHVNGLNTFICTWLQEAEGGGAKKKLEMDVVQTPAPAATSTMRRRSMSSAKRRKTISEIPHTPETKAILLTEPKTQKALFQDDATTGCVADSQSEIEDAESRKAAASAEMEASSVPSSAASSVSIGVLPDAPVVAAMGAPAAASSDIPGNAVIGAPTDAALTNEAAVIPSVESAISSGPKDDSTNIASIAHADVPPASATSALTSTASCSDRFSIGKSGKEMKVTATPAATGTTGKEVGAPAKAKAPAAPAIWTCATCGCSNARTRRLCKDCRTPRTAFQTTNTEVLAIAKKPAPIPKTPSATTRVTRNTTAAAAGPRTPVAPAMTTRRILTTPKTLARPTASATRRQLTTPMALSKSTARKLPLGPPKSPPQPSSGSAQRQTQGSSGSQMSISSGSSVSVLEMTPVRVTERAGSKRSLSTSSSTSGVKRQRLNETSTPRKREASNDLSTDEKLNSDHNLERLATPRHSASSRRSTRSLGATTPVKTPAAKPARQVRSVIGITGVDMETRGVIECAVHAIDASMASESGYRKARVVKSVDYAAAVTHLIVGEDTKRTIKVLFAIARGAWIVSEAWVFSSLEQEQWLPEEAFELDMFSNKHARMHPEKRQIFKSMRFFVGSNVEPSREVLQSLLQSAGGEVWWRIPCFLYATRHAHARSFLTRQICNQISVADMVICGDGSLFRRAQRTGIRVVTAKVADVSFPSEMATARTDYPCLCTLGLILLLVCVQWVFDSIGSMKLEDDSKYRLSAATSSLEEE